MDKLRIAGARTKLDEDTTGKCLVHEGRPGTPPHVSKWRKFREPGKRVVHPGLRDLESREVLKVTVASDHIEDVWGKPMSAYAMAKDAQRESVYRSSKREPLGRSYVRGHAVPDGTFGKKTASATESTKELLWAPSDGEDKSMPPGHQRSRNYEWGVDPVTHRFGVGSGSHVAMNGNTSHAWFPQEEPTRELPSLLVDRLGRSRRLALHDNGEQHVYGKTTLRDDAEWDARQCIMGDEEHEPDADLGLSCTPGFRNVATNRVFGVPTVRSDLCTSQRRSIADAQNYGDDPTAATLVNPPAVSEDAWRRPRSKADILDLFSAISTTLPPNFDHLFADLQDANGMASLEAVHRATTACRASSNGGV